jgi:hypothetical protein
MDDMMQRRRAMMAALATLQGAKYTQYTTTAGSVNAEFNNAAISPTAPNEILIWNIRGTVNQGIGTVGGKMGIVVLQDGSVVNMAGGYRRMASITAPDDSTPASSWANDSIFTTIQDGKYHAGTGNVFYVGIGNTIDFIQIPYNIGWAVGGN